MLAKYCHDAQHWDDAIPLVLFAACEAVQESFAFSPAQLVFGQGGSGSIKGPQRTACLVEKEGHKHFRVFTQNQKQSPAGLFFSLGCTS